MIKMYGGKKQKGAELGMKHLKTVESKFVNRIRRENTTMVWPHKESGLNNIEHLGTGWLCKILQDVTGRAKGWQDIKKERTCEDSGKAVYKNGNDTTKIP
jgi:hypothetical protein